MSRTVAALLRKELLVELRTLESVPGMSLFAVTTFVVFHFALNKSSVEGDLAAARPRACKRPGGALAADPGAL